MPLLAWVLLALAGSSSLHAELGFVEQLYWAATEPKPIIVYHGKHTLA